MSLSFIDMVNLLLKQKPELTAESIRDMVDEKKRKVGAGYLTDQGALFLVAADLGISFDNAPKSQAGLKDLYIGAKDVTITGRIMSIYPPFKFIKKETNEESSTRTLVIYDKDSKIRVKLWDKQVKVPDEIGLHAGDLVKISKGYVRAGLDGKPILNLGSYGVVEPTQDNSDIPQVDSLAISVDNITEVQDYAVVTGIVNSNPRISDFVNARGEASKSLQLQVSNESNTRSLRSVIWNVDDSRIPKVFRTGSKVKMIGVKIKPGNSQFGNGDFELHGDEGTVLEFSDSQQDVDVMPMRLISVGEETGKGSFVCLAVDRAARPFTLTIDRGVADQHQLSAGTMIECVPSRIFGNAVTLSKDDSYLRITDDDPSFPSLTKFEVKVKDLLASGESSAPSASSYSTPPIMLEAIVLQAPSTTDVNLKSGESVPVTSTLLGDDTGQIRLVGWRNQSTAVNKLSVGDRIKLQGATVGAGREGVEITLRSYSSIISLG